ncbi:MAG: hypothetical protein J1F60_07440 [Oscillospiraceae bacterium]|nr:hypothetical protein [Oscillospiraceae bacterium]
MNQEIIAKAREAKSAEELLSLAKENNIELTEDEAKEYYDRLHATGELSDDELDSVAGGGGCTESSRCPMCGGTNRIYLRHGHWHCYDCANKG